MSEGSDPQVSVVVRTTGRRPVLLAEALASVSAQDRAPHEIIVAWHDVDGTDAPQVPEDARLERVDPGLRGKPLNTGLDAASGDVVAFLDDDDLAMPSWVETFAVGASSAPGRMVRAIAVDRPVRRSEHGVEAVGPDEVPEGRDAPFDYFTMLTRSRTPLCSIALPVAAVREAGLRFAEDLPVLEDWDFLLRAAPMLGVHDTGQITSVYRRWVDGHASLDTEGEDVWAQTRTEVVQRLDQNNLVLPPGSTRRLLALFEQERAAKEARAEAAEQAQLAKEALREVERLQRRIDQIENSTSWKLTAPLRRVLDATRGRD